MFFYAPLVFYRSLVITTVLTVLVDLVVRFIVRPIIVRWHRPMSEPHGALFQIGANERVVSSVPARFKPGRRWQVGSLVLTNQSLWFFHDAWDVETWKHRRAEILGLRAETPPSFLLGLLRGLPERLMVDLASGESLTLIVADADEVVGWLPPNPDSQATRTPPGGVADSPTTSLERTA